MSSLKDAAGNESTDAVLVDRDGVEHKPDQQPQFDLPYHLTFASVIQGASRSFIALGYDEAMSHNRENALAMRRDCRIMGWLAERKESVVSLKWHLEVDDETDPAQKAVLDGMTKIIRSVPRLKRIFRQLLEAIWYGRYGVELCWRWEEMDLPAVLEPSLFPLGNDRQTMLQKHLNAGGTLEQPADEEGDPTPKAESQKRRVFKPFKHRPVNGDKINFTWEGTPMIGVYAAWESNLRSEGADVVSVTEQRGKLKPVITWDNQKPVLLLNREWRERFLIHTYDPDDADYFEAEKAGGVFGVGVRSRIYWLNWIRMDYAAWIQDFFDRVGLGFIVIKYTEGNAKSEAEANSVAKKWSRRSVITLPVSPDQIRSGGSIEVVDVPSAGALVVQNLIEYADKHLERFMLRQSMSSGESGREGLGGTAGPAMMAQNTETQRIRADAEELAETLTGNDDEPGLVSIILKHSYPGVKFPVRFRFNVDDENPLDKLNAISMAAAIGVEFEEDSVRELTGMPKPEAGQKVVGGKQEMPMPPGFGDEGEGDAAPPDDDPRTRMEDTKPPFMNGKH